VDQHVDEPCPLGPKGGLGEVLGLHGPGDAGAVGLPLFFTSSALYPLAIMPVWLRVVAHANPLSYEVHGMRDLLLGISAGGMLWLDFTVVASFLVVTALIAAKTYPRAIL
jgi:ABC-2 type transport system permease protein